MVALQGVWHILWGSWNPLKWIPVILLVASKHYFSNKEFIPKDKEKSFDYWDHHTLERSTTGVGGCSKDISKDHSFTRQAQMQYPHSESQNQW